MGFGKFRKNQPFEEAPPFDGGLNTKANAADVGLAQTPSAQNVSF